MNPPSSTATTIRFTDELRQAAGDQWDRVIGHKFTKELAAGSIDRTVLKRYLIQDHRFLDAFVILLASIIANARTLDDRIPGCLFLATITGKENTYFERSFQAIVSGCTMYPGFLSIDERCGISWHACRNASRDCCVRMVLPVMGSNRKRRYGPR